MTGANELQTSEYIQNGPLRRARRDKTNCNPLSDVVCFSKNF